MTPKPHVSSALVQLRHGVTVCALLAGVCALAQMLVFAFVHFTDVRFESEAPSVGPPPVAVVVTRAGGDQAARRETPAQASLIKESHPQSASHAPSRAEAAASQSPAAKAVSAAPALTRWDVVLRRASDGAVTFGLLATACMGVLLLMGVAVAGGGCVPGVERAVSACTWGMVLAIGCIPWRDVAPSVPWPGVFVGYATMTAASASANAGTASGAALFAEFVLMPVVVLVGALIVMARFRAGVAAGVILTAVSELDEALDREMAGIRRRGVGSLHTRPVGVLNQPMGGGAEPQPEPAAGGRGKADPGLKRPI